VKARGPGKKIEKKNDKRQALNCLGEKAGPGTNRRENSLSSKEEGEVNGQRNLCQKGGYPILDIKNATEEFF